MSEHSLLRGKFPVSSQLQNVCYFWREMLNKCIMFSNSKIIVWIILISILNTIIMIMTYSFIEQAYIDINWFTSEKMMTLHTCMHAFTISGCYPKYGGYVTLSRVALALLFFPSICNVTLLLVSGSCSTGRLKPSLSCYTPPLVPLLTQKGVLTVPSLATGSVGDGSQPGALRVRDHRLTAGVWTAPLSSQPACAALPDPAALL